MENPPLSFNQFELSLQHNVAAFMDNEIRGHAASHTAKWSAPQGLDATPQGQGGPNSRQFNGANVSISPVETVITGRSQSWYSTSRRSSIDCHELDRSGPV